MEVFKTDILKNLRSERFQKKDLIEILKCGYCQKTNHFILNFWLAVNFVDKTFSKLVNHLLSQKKIFYQMLMKLEKST